MKRFWVLISTASAVLVLTQLPGLGTYLRYDADAIAVGEFWRLLTGHFVHLGVPHATLNLAGLALIALAFWRELTWLEWLSGMVGCSILISLGLLLWAPHLQWYMGLSGVLYGLLAMITCILLRDRSKKMGILVAVFLLARLGYEQWQGPSQETEKLIGGAVVTAAHLLGAASGVLLGLFSLWCGKARQSAAG